MYGTQQRKGPKILDAPQRNEKKEKMKTTNPSPSWGTVDLHQKTKEEIPEKPEEKNSVGLTRGPAPKGKKQRRGGQAHFKTRPSNRHDALKTGKQQERGG